MKTKKSKFVFNLKDLIKQLKKAKKGEEIFLYEIPIHDVHEFMTFRKNLEQLVIFQRGYGYKINGVISFMKTK